MKVDVITIFPGMFQPLLDYGITHKAIDQGKLNLRCWNPRDFTTDRRRTVDGRPYGGGPGMVMKPEPLTACLDTVQLETTGPVIYLSPQGKQLDQDIIKKMSKLSGIIFLTGRYEGVDERVLQTRIDREISIGDYVLAGGELVAMVAIEAITRLIPGVLGNDLSAKNDSFSSGLLDYPHYTRPKIFKGIAVPDILLSGNHNKIQTWRLWQSLNRTRQRRPDLLTD